MRAEVLTRSSERVVDSTVRSGCCTHQGVVRAMLRRRGVAQMSKKSGHVGEKACMLYSNCG
jgi:hypothetical protein